MVTPLHCLEAFTTNNNCASSLSSVVTSSSFCANGPGTLQCRIECSALMSVGRGKFGLNSFHYALLLSGPKVNKNYYFVTPIIRSFISYYYIVVATGFLLLNVSYFGNFFTAVQDRIQSNNFFYSLQVRQL